MGKRISQIYTRTGDDGYTSSADGERIRKDDLLIESIGTIDELNSAVGLLKLKIGQNKLADLCEKIQHHLFDLGAELTLPTHPKISSEMIQWLEQEIDTLNQTLPPLEEFILPGGNEQSAYCHMARCIARRAERCTTSVLFNRQSSSLSVQYLNRLSDLFFVMSRYLTDAENETEWNNQHKGKKS